jgi:hypothetical protein
MGAYFDIKQIIWTYHNGQSNVNVSMNRKTKANGSRGVTGRQPSIPYQQATTACEVEDCPIQIVIKP